MVEKIISEEKRIWHERFVREFTLKSGYDRYSFNVNGNGKPIFSCKEAEEKYQYCLSHPDEFEDHGVTDKGWWRTEPAQAICEVCGSEIVLEGVSRCKKCGQWHDQNGQSLRAEYWMEDLLPPEYWEE